MKIVTLHGNDLLPFLDDVARLRIEVFREFPYLYDGTVDYEAKYLQSYTQTENSLFVLAFDHQKVVGASTGLPLQFANAEFKTAFLAQNLPVQSFFYFGESVLDPNYRGRGIGLAFFHEREKFAQEIGLQNCCFCAVDRPQNHPARPANYQPLDEFWKKRGYKKFPELQTTFDWKEVGQDAETTHAMTFWLKNMAPS